MLTANNRQIFHSTSTYTVLSMCQNAVIFNTWMNWRSRMVEAGRSAEKEAVGINTEELETKAVRFIYSQSISLIFPL